MSQKAYQCSTCAQLKGRGEFHEKKAGDRRREVTSQCRECRREAYFKRRYPDSVCMQCLHHRPLDRNRICSACNQESGLRQCRECCEILPLFLKFRGHRQCCNDCWRKLRRLRRHGVAASRSRRRR